MNNTVKTVVKVAGLVAVMAVLANIEKVSVDVSVKRRHNSNNDLGETVGKQISEAIAKQSKGLL